MCYIKVCKGEFYYIKFDVSQTMYPTGVQSGVHKGVQRVILLCKIGVSQTMYPTGLQSGVHEGVQKYGTLLKSVVHCWKVWYIVEKCGTFTI